MENCHDDVGVYIQAEACPCFKCRHRQGCEIECNDYRQYVSPTNKVKQRKYRLQRKRRNMQIKQTATQHPAKVEVI